MVAAFRSIGTLFASTSGATSAAVATPSGFAANDLLVMCWVQSNFSASAPTFPTSLPSGWSTLGTTANPANNMASAIYYKIASGSEGASQTWSGQAMGTFFNSRGQMLAFTGCNTSTPIVTSGTPEWAVTSNTQTTAAQTHPSVTPTTAGSGVLLFRCQYESASTNRTFTSSITSASSPAGVEQSDPTATNNADIAIYTRDGGFALAAQSYTTTSSAAGSGGQHMWSVILNAAPTVALPPSVGILLG